MFEFLKQSWKTVSITAGGLAIIATIFTFSDRYVTQDILALELKVVDQKVASALDTVQKSVQYQFNANRYATLTDQASQLRLLLQKNPNDLQLQEELKRVLEEKVWKDLQGKP